MVAFEVIFRKLRFGVWPVSVGYETVFWCRYVAQSAALALDLAPLRFL